MRRHVRCDSNTGCDGIWKGTHTNFAVNAVLLAWSCRANLAGGADLEPTVQCAGKFKSAKGDNAPGYHSDGAAFSDF
jgi:hypothetical protein